MNRMGKKPTKKQKNTLERLTASKAEFRCHSAPCWDILEVVSSREHIGLRPATERRALRFYQASHFSERNVCVIVIYFFLHT